MLYARLEYHRQGQLVSPGGAGVDAAVAVGKVDGGIIGGTDSAANYGRVDVVNIGKVGKYGVGQHSLRGEQVRPGASQTRGFGASVKVEQELVLRRHPQQQVYFCIVACDSLSQKSIFNPFTPCDFQLCTIAFRADSSEGRSFWFTHISTPTFFEEA